MNRLIILIVILCQFFLTQCGSGGGGKIYFKAATLNMYVGFDYTKFFDGSIDLSDPAKVQELIDSTIDDIEATEASTRIKAMAKAIVNEDLDVVGLQEVVKLTIGAFTVSDYINELIEEIKNLGGAAYEARSFVTFSLTLPITYNGTPTSFTFLEQKSILYKSSESCQPLDTGWVFEAARDPVLIIGQEVKYTSGYLGVNCNAPSGPPFYFFTTHLEQDYLPAVQQAQLSELLSGIQNQVGDENASVILTGDFNAVESGGDTAVYETILNANYVDGFRQIYPDAVPVPGYTCCQSADLSNTASSATKRLDYLFYRSPNLTAGNADIFADETVAKSSGSGTLWPSDHFGMAVTFDQ